jgi:hypothetical protein
MAEPATIRQRIKHTAARLRHLERVKRALRWLQDKRRKQLAAATSHGLTIFGLDYAWGNPQPVLFKRAGVKFVMTYVSHDPSKDPGRAERDALKKAGIKVGLVFESTSGRALAGFDAGKQDAAFAKDRAHVLGLDGMPIYFAVDFDATDAQKPTIARYLEGAVSVLGKSHVGVYGGYHVVKYLVNMKTCDWFWQTYAWSGGAVHPSTHIYQYSNGHSVAGVSCDFNKASQAGLGSMR